MCLPIHMTKERDAQQQTLAVQNHEIEELEKKVKYLTEELEKEKQMLFSVQKVRMQQKTLDYLSNIKKTFPFHVSRYYVKERDEQQQTFVAAMGELEKQVKSGSKELEMEKQKLLSVQEVGIYGTEKYANVTPY